MQRSIKLKPKHKAESFNFEAIGTSWQIVIFEAIAPAQLTAMHSAVFERIEEFDKNYSRFRSDSLVAKMSKKAGDYILPPDARPLLDFYKQLYDTTNGLVTPLIGDSLVAAGYDSNYSLQPKTIKKSLSWDEALVYDYPKLKIKMPTVLDFGAAGKGYLVDIIANLLQTHNILNYCINAGGDIAYYTNSDKELSVALENPSDSTEAIGVAKLHNNSLCGSAGNKRAWLGYNHIINPKSLRSPRLIKAVWVVAENTMLSDGLSTALFFTDPLELSKHFKFEYAIISGKNNLRASKNFPAEFFTNNQNVQETK